jgi:methylated-DNA-[protein]-cysteine S-methyltransferase
MFERRAFYDSPIGTIEIIGTERGIIGLLFTSRKRSASKPDFALGEAVSQIDEYFRGKRKEFSLRLHLEGTEFYLGVWRELQKVSYGQTVSYGEVAVAVGRPKAARAVGQANHHNPISIIIPCHRIVGGDGRLVGYGGGLWRKEWLLAHEKKYSRSHKGRAKA